MKRSVFGGGDGEWSVSQFLEHGGGLYAEQNALHRHPSRPAMVQGLFVDGVRNVTLHFGSGRAQAVTVSGNLLYVRTASLPRSATWRDDHGRSRHQAL